VIESATMATLYCSRLHNGHNVLLVAGVASGDWPWCPTAAVYAGRKDSLRLLSELYRRSTLLSSFVL